MTEYNEIEANDLLEMMGNQSISLIDVRNDEEVARGIIPGAVHIPLAMLPVRFESLSKTENIVFYCHSGIRSEHAAAFASSKGCKSAYNLSGGILAWSKAGHPLVPK